MKLPRGILLSIGCAAVLAVAWSTVEDPSPPFAQAVTVASPATALDEAHAFVQPIAEVAELATAGEIRVPADARIALGPMQHRDHGEVALVVCRPRGTLDSFNWTVETCPRSAVAKITQHADAVATTLTVQVHAPARVVRLHVADRATGSRWTVPLDLPVPAGARMRHVVRLEEPRGLPVTVHAFARGEHVLEGSVAARPDAIDLSGTTRPTVCNLDQSGTVVPRLDEVVHCEAAVPGWVPFTALRWQPDAGPTEGAVRLWVVEAERWQLSVRTEGGAPVEQATVTLEPRWTTPASVSCTAHAVRVVLPDPIRSSTDAHGHATLPVGRGLDYVIRLQHPEHLELETFVAAGTRPSAFSLTRGSAVTATVVDESGSALPGVRVEPHGLARRPVHTDSQGRFRFTGVDPAAGLLLRLQRDGYFAREFRLACNQHEPFNTRIPLCQGLSFGGQVVDRLGEPATTAVVRLLPDDAHQQWRATRSGLCDAEGRFHVAELAPGGYRLEVATSGDDGFEHVDRVEAGWQDYMVCLGGPTSATLRVHVRDRNSGAPMERFRLTLLRAAGDHVRCGTTFDSQGTLGVRTLTGLEPGDVVVRVEVLGRPVVEVPATLQAGANELQVDLGPAQ